VSVLPDVVTRNWRLKVSALALAVFLWAIVTVQPRNRDILPAVPVQVVVTDPEWTLAELPSPATVSVQLGGPTRELLQLGRGSDAAILRIPIDAVGTGDTIVRLRTEWVVVLGGSNIVVQEILPATVALRLEPAMTVSLPLAVRTRGELPEEWALATPLGLSPPLVRVRGPARILEGLDSIPLEPLDLDGVRESRIYRVRVDTSGLGRVTVEQQTADIAIRLDRSAERSVGGVPVVAEAPMGVDPGSLVVSPETIQVTLRGALSLVNQVGAEALSAVVAAQDIEGLAAGAEVTVPIRVRGVPNLVRAFSAVDSVRVQRLVLPPVPVTPGQPAPADPDTTDAAPGDPAGGGDDPPASPPPGSPPSPDTTGPARPGGGGP